MSTNAERFLAGYLDAWRTNEVDGIRSLFTSDATYRSSPRDLDPAVGVDAIVAHWFEDRDEPGTWSFEGGVELRTAQAAVIRGVTTYTAGPKASVYDNVWLVRFAEDGRASEFQDWWFQREG